MVRFRYGHVSAGDHFTVMRGTWFEVQGDKWYPFEEEEAWSIEKNHCGPELQEKVGMLGEVGEKGRERSKRMRGWGVWEGKRRWKEEWSQQTEWEWGLGGCCVCLLLI